MKDENVSLASFLNYKVKLNVTFSQNKLTVDLEKTSPEELKHAVNKFIYHQNLNCQYWVSTKGKNVKINKFKNAKNPRKQGKT